MKAREAVDLIQKFDPDEEIIFLMWTKDKYSWAFSPVSILLEPGPAMA
jgi:hypothetical protein